MGNDPADAVDYCNTLVESILNLSNMYSVEVIPLFAIYMRSIMTIAMLQIV